MSTAAKAAARRGVTAVPAVEHEAPPPTPPPIKVNDLMRLAERLAVVEHALYTMAKGLAMAPGNYSAALADLLPELPDAYLFGLADVTADVARTLMNLDDSYERARVR